MSGRLNKRYHKPTSESHCAQLELVIQRASDSFQVSLLLIHYHYSAPFGCLNEPEARPVLDFGQNETKQNKTTRVRFSYFH